MTHTRLHVPIPLLPRPLPAAASLLSMLYEPCALHVLTFACCVCVRRSFHEPSISPAPRCQRDQPHRVTTSTTKSHDLTPAKLQDMINESTASCTDAKPPSNTSMQHASLQHASPQHASPQHASPHLLCCRSLRVQHRCVVLPSRIALSLRSCRTLVALVSHSRCTCAPVTLRCVCVCLFHICFM